MSEKRYVELRWSRCLDGYRFTAGSKGIESVSNRWNRWETYSPLKIPDLFAKFAHKKHTPEGMLEFANDWGLLTGSGMSSISTGGRVIRRAIVMAVDAMLAHHAEVRRALDQFNSGDPSRLITNCNWDHVRAALQFQVVRDVEDRLTIELTLPDLLHAIWYLFAMHGCKGTQLLKCERCGEPFVVGGGTKRRSTSKYCDTPCQTKAWQERNGRRTRPTKPRAR
jgi:hypothetical protein